jgi:hypothetical protein
LFSNEKSHAEMSCNLENFVLVRHFLSQKK